MPLNPRRARVCTGCGGGGRRESRREAEEKARILSLLRKRRVESTDRTEGEESA